MLKKYSIFLVALALLAGYSLFRFYNVAPALTTSSPWLKELRRTRSVSPLTHNEQTDVVIVGGGISGMVTAYFTLRETDKKVLLIEAATVASGATGHNAGQMATYFEKKFTDMIEEFGITATLQAQSAMLASWDIFDGIYKGANLTTPYHRFMGYDGCTTVDEILALLKANKYRKEGGAQLVPLQVLDDPVILSKIPVEYTGLYEIAPAHTIKELLQTKVDNYIAVISELKGCLNSALFTEELAGYLLANYPDRFKILEHSPVNAVRLYEDHAELAIKENKIRAMRVVLCTNGFTNFKIINMRDGDIDTKFHQMVRPRIGYMIGYLEQVGRAPCAISYGCLNNDAYEYLGIECPYFYLTRWPFRCHQDGKCYGLVCIGGPENDMPKGTVYESATDCPMKISKVIDDFLQKVYRYYNADTRADFFCWHGLMGYTSNLIRRVGPEPLNPILLYNLGCNGVGIMPALYSGKKIAGYLKHQQFEPSIFDVKEWELAC